MRKTKIICTLGPASDTAETIRAMIEAGMNVARFNFSHGTQKSHLETFRTLVKVRNELQAPVATVLDTKGPEIRIKTFAEGKVTLDKDQKFTLTINEIEGTKDAVSITYKDLPKDIAVGSPILIDDGLIELLVESKTDTDIVCKVEVGGMLSNRKGINLPGTRFSMPYLNQYDYDDIVFGIRTGFDYIAASFVRTKEDVLEVRKILDENGGRHVSIISKVENAEGVENIDEIIEVSDAIMIARGDMGVEIPFEEIPMLQKKIIKATVKAGKPVVIATQMLESMSVHSRPTRAETNDVANAIYDGTSATMLSGETANGKFPVEAVKTMAKIALRAEKDINYKKRFFNASVEQNAHDITDAISHATCLTAYNLNAKAIITVTELGGTARMISRFRADIPIIACTPNATTLRQLALSWGVRSIMVGEENVTDVLFESAVNAAIHAGAIEYGDLVILTAGVPLGVSGSTNLIKVVHAGE
ncbi:MAG: pyruvate kinase [Christensenellaceae bacterium]|nr:pyruvate kinase [Christensenellaceae bacterium]